MSLRGMLPGTADDAPAETVSASIDAALTVLKNERRRRVIDLLYAEGPELQLGEIAEHLAALEHGPTYSSGDRKRVYVGLYQCHLDKLAEIDAVEFEPNRGIVRAGEELDAVYELLEATREYTEAEA